MDVKQLETIDYDRGLVLTDVVGDSAAYEVAKTWAYTLALFNVQAGTATVQFTLNSKEDVQNDDAVWFDWAQGAVSADEQSFAKLDTNIGFLRIKTSTTNVRYSFHLRGPT